MSNDLYPLKYYLSVFSREHCIGGYSGKFEDGLSQELITAVYSVASDKNDMTRICRALRKYGVNTLSKLKETPAETITTKWRGIGTKTAEKLFHLQSLSVDEEENEVIVRRYIVGELEKQIKEVVTNAYQAGDAGKDFIVDVSEIMNKALFDDKK